MIKKVFLSILFCGLSVTLAIAQSETTIEDRLAKLEAQIAQQNTTIANLKSEVQSVVKQNLALKKNLNLKPTIAKSTPREDLDYRVLEVIGDKSSNEVKVVITAHYSGIEDVSLYFHDLEIADELGSGYNEENRTKSTIDGVSDEVFPHSVKFHPETPYTIFLEIKKYNPDAQYIKHLSFKSAEGLKNAQAVFENLPIKWVESTD